MKYWLNHALKSAMFTLIVWTASSNNVVNILASKIDSYSTIQALYNHLFQKKSKTPKS